MKELETLVQAGAILSAKVGTFPLGAAVVRGNRVVWAVQGAENSHGIHRSDGIILKLVTHDMIDWWNVDGTLYGTLERMDAEEAAAYRLAEWHRFRDDPETGPYWREFFDSTAQDLFEE